MFEIDCQNCDTLAVVTTVDLERNNILTCDVCENIILILDDECRKQLGLKYDPDYIAPKTKKEFNKLNNQFKT